MISLSQEDLYRYSTNLVELATTKFVGKNGLCFAGFDPITGRTSSQSLIQDLGDYVQYVAWYGKLYNQSQYIEWAENQINTAYNLSSQKNGLMYPFINAWKGKNPFVQWLPSYPLYLDDTLLGLIEVYNISKNEEIFRLSTKLADAIIDAAINEEGFVASVLMQNPHIRLEIYAARTNGAFIEEFTNIYKISHRDTYLQYATRIIDAWITSKYFENYGLIPDLLYKEYFPMESLALFESTRYLTVPFILLSRMPKPFRKLFNQAIFLILTKILRKRCLFSRRVATLMKSNTFIMFGLMALYRQEKKPYLRNAFYKWLGSVFDKLRLPQGCYLDYWDADGYKSSPQIKLTMNHAILEVLIDAYWTFEDIDILNEAEKLAQYWIKKQDETTGLFPEHPETPSGIVDLDSNTDMSMNMLKLYDITKNKAYYLSAIATIKGINEYLLTPEGYALNYDTKEGRITNYGVKIKFNTLHLKALLLLQELHNGKSIFKDYRLWSLSIDR